MSVRVEAIRPVEVAKHQLRMPSQEVWQRFSPADKFHIMFGATPNKVSGPYVAEVIREQFDEYNRWRIGYGNLNRGGSTAERELALNRVANDPEYFEKFVYPAAEEFTRTVQAAQPFVNEDLGFILELGLDTRSEASTDTILNVWRAVESPGRNSISERQKDILRGKMTLKQLAS